MLQFLPLILRYGKVAVAAVALGTIALYAMNAEKNRGLVKMLEAETARHIQTIAHQDEQIRALNARLKGNNARWLELMQREQQRFAKAQAEADRIMAERDTITAELAASRRDWQEAIADDPELATFSRLDVPGAVFFRLCRATGDAWCS